MPKKRLFNPRVAIERARSGEALDAELRKFIDIAEQFGNISAVTELRAILQARRGTRAVQRISTVQKHGSAAWAFAQFNAAPETPYSWSALTPDGEVVVNLWDDDRDFERVTFQPKPWAREPITKKSATRTTFFQTLEIAKASRRGLLRVILSTAVDRNVRPVNRASGQTRPWYNQDGSPVLIRLVDLRMPTAGDLQGYWCAELAEQDRRPLTPFPAPRS